MTVFVIDKTAMEANYTHFFDTGSYEAFNSNPTPVNTFAPPSFNYFDYILGVTAFRVSSTVEPSWFLTTTNTIGTFTAFHFIRETAIHWRQRQCINPAISKFVLEQQLCYDVCPSGYATDASIDYCVLCHYTCLTCQVDGTSCITCTANTSRTIDNATSACPCDTGFFDNGVVQCSACNYTCLTCATVESNCTSCDASRTLTNSTCICSTGFYDIGNNTQACVACDQTCLTC